MNKNFYSDTELSGRVATGNRVSIVTETTWLCPRLGEMPTIARLRFTAVRLRYLALNFN